MKLAVLKKELEVWIQQGQGYQARKKLSLLKPNEIQRKDAVDFANLARRLNLNYLALKILHPTMSPNALLKEPPTSMELAIHAAVLTKLGALDLAYNVLNKIKTKGQQFPEIWLYLSYNHMARWDYNEASKALKKYVESPTLTEYQRSIGKINLAACYFFNEKNEKGYVLLGEVLKISKKRNWHLLYGNGLELSAQMAVNNNDWKKAQYFLKKGYEHITDPNSLIRFFIKKWMVILELKKSQSHKNKKYLHSLRKEALLRSHWETVRDCDYFLGISTNKHTLVEKVYYGTPYNPYRQRIHRHYFREIKNKQKYIWRLNPPHSTKEKVKCFNVPLGIDEERNISLKPQQALHRLLQILTSDFYKPVLIGSLHHQLFPGEYFNPFTSPKRVSFAILRLNKWLTKNDFPVHVLTKHGQSRLEATNKFSFIINPRIVTLSQIQTDLVKDVYIKRLKKYFIHKTFSSKQASEKLQISHSLVNLILSYAVKIHKLRTIGKGRGTLYSFLKKR